MVSLPLAVAWVARMLFVLSPKGVPDTCVICGGESTSLMSDAILTSIYIWTTTVSQYKKVLVSSTTVRDTYG